MNICPIAAYNSRIGSKVPPSYNADEAIPAVAL